MTSAARDDFGIVAALLLLAAAVGMAAGSMMLFQFQRERARRVHCSSTLKQVKLDLTLAPPTNIKTAGTE